MHGDWFPDIDWPQPDIKYKISTRSQITDDQWVDKLRKGNEMDKAYKKLGKEAKKIEKDTKEVLKKDKARDKIIDKAKDKMKGKC